MDNKEFDISEAESLTLENLFGDELADELDFLKEESSHSQQQIAEPEAPTEPVPPSAQKEKKGKFSWQKNALLYLHDFVYLLATIILIFMLCFRVVVVSGTSMNNTLLDGDYLLLLGDVFYRNPQPGDVIVASKDSFDNGAPIVKRVIATEGQEVDIDFNSGIVYVDGEPLDEPYTMTPTNNPEGTSFPLVVEEGCIFVMGDNRNASKDSRDPEIGQIDRREILGKVIFLFFPGTNKGTHRVDFSRIGVVS